MLACNKYWSSGQIQTAPVYFREGSDDNYKLGKFPLGCSCIVRNLYNELLWNFTQLQFIALGKLCFRSKSVKILHILFTYLEIKIREHLTCVIKEYVFYAKTYVP